MAFKQPVASTSFLSANETATEYKPKFPSGTKNGYLVICSFLVFGSGRTYTATGWTQLGTAATITGGQYVSFYRIATKADEEGVGTTTYPIKISGSAVSGTWATTWVSGVNPTTPVVGGENKAAAASTTVKWPTATPTEVTCMDFLMVQGVEEGTFTTPTGFTARATGTSALHSFSRELTSKTATGETSTTQSKSTPTGTTRIFILGEVEEEGATPATIALSTVGTSFATMPMRAPTQIPLGAIAATSTAAAKLTAPSLLALSAGGASAAVARLNAPTLVSLGTVPGASTASLALTAPALIALLMAGGSAVTLTVSTASVPFLTLAAAASSGAALGLAASSRLALAAAGVGAATVRLNAPAFLALGSVPGVAATVLKLTAPTLVALAPAAGVGHSATVIALPVQIGVFASGQGNPGLALTVPGVAFIAIGIGGHAGATAAITVPMRLALPMSGSGPAAVKLTAPAMVGAVEGAGSAAAELVLTTAADLMPIAAGVGAAGLALTRPVVIVVIPGEGRTGAFDRGDVGETAVLMVGVPKGTEQGRVGEVAALTSGVPQHGRSRS